MPEHARETAGREPLHNLCCACGVITPDSLWTAWVRRWVIDEAADDDTWVPAPDGASDPMLKCPACGWEHVDDDSNPGIFDGTLREVEDERAKLIAERDEQYGADHAEFWSHRWREVIEEREVAGA
ncbi:MAG TPA: hypothetical protein VFZ00_28455 [Solirubrobacter sp.]|nr:hypothetical protein [Solirubrobacter sp.]